MSASTSGEADDHLLECQLFLARQRVQAVMPDRDKDPSERTRLREKALSRWANEGGAGEGGRLHPASTIAADAPPLTNAELVQLQIRVIALENLLTVLLAGSSERRLALARDMAAYISPRPGFTPHRLTIHAAARMISLVEGASHFREPELEDEATSSARLQR
jgi:hypothetical protein